MPRPGRLFGEIPSISAVAGDDIGLVIDQSRRRTRHSRFRSAISAHGVWAMRLPEPVVVSFDGRADAP